MSSARATTRCASHIGAEKNHLCPRSEYSPPRPPPPTGVALVVFARTSDPPCFSVMPMPNQIERLPEIGLSEGSYSSLNSLSPRVSHSAGSFCSRGMLACVIVAGQSAPYSICAYI